MHNTIFILCLPNPFRKFPLTFCKAGDKICECRDLGIFNERADFVTYDFEAIVNVFRDRALTELPRVTDMRTAIKLLTGKPKSEFSSSDEPWQLRRAVGRFAGKAAMVWLTSILEFKTIDYDNLKESPDMIALVMSAFEKAWIEITEDLRRKGEYERFVTIECEIYNAFLQTQLKGVSVSQERLNTNRASLKTAYYRAIKRLELKHGFLAQQIHSNMSWKEIESFSDICKSAYEIDSDFWRFAEIYGEFDPFLNDLATAHNSLIDYNALLRYCIDKYARIYPRFDIVGTVTSRIMVVSPGFQYLKKTSRTMVVPSLGHSLLYADFAQFEPGIVAHHSKDIGLIDLYNKGDIYAELSIVLFGDTSNRKVAKILFLSFLYGMAKENLARLIEKVSSREACSSAFSFFDRFATLCAWKENVWNTAKQQGYAVTSLGNRRYIATSDKLSPKELRWIPNQIIQGTASLIFKKALIDISRTSKNVYFLLPMHDAILVEVPVGEEVNEKRSIERAFVKAFEEECPSIKAKVTFEHFAD
jgi:DNA polymerase I